MVFFGGLTAEYQNPIFWWCIRFTNVAACFIGFYKYKSTLSNTQNVSEQSDNRYFAWAFHLLRRKSLTELFSRCVLLQRFKKTNHTLQNCKYLPFILLLAVMFNDLSRRSTPFGAWRDWVSWAVLAHVKRQHFLNAENMSKPTWWMAL